MNDDVEAGFPVQYSGGPADGKLDVVPATDVALQVGDGGDAVFYRYSDERTVDKNGREVLVYIFVGPQRPTDLRVIAGGEQVQP
ncbi:hypothetical protein [Streptomyces sp. NPDC047981]|uniref:hypothetical protein n=1 Tax=Streptomyces sp. NPDC047981 TaxID=3154610 RepID=UPI00343CD0DF